MLADAKLFNKDHFKANVQGTEMLTEVIVQKETDRKWKCPGSGVKAQNVCPALIYKRQSWVRIYLQPARWQFYMKMNFSSGLVKRYLYR